MIYEETWRKSSYSKGESNCVEVADTTGLGVAVRDTQNRELGHLGFSAEAWGVFLRDVKTDRL
ncbi:hypothetical protein HDA32_000424 [Spinactinospora alkalitolerans]|uniref:DUF397 domain-containing protein n=1 Tax=Spinactinospora alkalitolerans TaxID=687207 RepID=A0A852TT64_9ACTN|nr:DUF397 domain-containing protein [Spinactinospora alkalitolerans]NYE45304.1 hypothetical protein [Spinactinospora alkalitolerans]